MKTSLHDAIKNNKIDDIRDIIKNNDTDVNAVDTNGDAPLHLAVKLENERILSLLLDANADINAKNSAGKTPFRLAVETENIFILNLLLSAGADVNAIDSEGNSPLHTVVMMNSYNILMFLLNSGSHVDAKNNDESTALHLALATGNTNIIKLLINAGAEAHIVNQKGVTPLLLAAKLGNEEILKLMIDSHAYIHAKSESGNTSLHFAVTSENSNATRTLLNFGADVNVTNDSGETPLHKAAESGCVDTVKLLIKSGAIAYVKDKKGVTPLHTAVKSNQETIAKLLLTAGADIDAADNFRSTPMHCVAQTNNSNIAALLIDSGSSLNARDNNNVTPLIRAIQSQSVDVVRQLIEAGVHLSENLFTNDDTALHLAAKYPEIVQLLLDAGANVHLKNAVDNSPLHYAVKSENPVIVKKLVRAGHYVNVNGNLSILKIFSKIGVDVNEDEHSTFANFVRKIPSKLRSIEKCFTDKNSLIRGTRFLIDYVNVNRSEEDEENSLIQLLKYMKTDPDGLTLLKTKLEDYSLKEIFYKIILEHVAKMKALNLSVNSSLLDHISETPVYNDYFSLCTQELDIAKSTKLYKCWVTFFNLLVDDKRKLVKYAGNEDLIKDFEKRVVEFPIYGAAMKKNVNKGINARKSYDESVNVLSNFLLIFNPTHLIVRDTLDLLSEEDWRKLCE